MRKMYFLMLCGSALAWYAACVVDDTENTWSSSSRDRAFVSGTKNRMTKKPNTFHAAYQPKAPWGLNAPSNGGKVIATTKLL